MSGETKELLKWLHRRLRATEKATREAVRLRDFGEAQLCEGISQAYAFTIMHIKGKR